MKIAPGFTRRRTEVVEVDDGLNVGRASFLPYGQPEVLTLPEAADLLQVSEGVVEGMAEDGEVPARKLGDAWRFSRIALIDWLGRND